MLKKAKARYVFRKKEERKSYILEHPFTCAYCGKTFTASRRGSKYCSKMCCDKGWQRAHHDEIMMTRRKRYAKFAKQYRALRQFRYIDLVDRMERDPELYARYRAKRREYQARWRRKVCGVASYYRPALSRRIPDYLRMHEEVLSATSVMIVNNLSDEQLKENMAFSVELSRDRSRKRDRFGEIR